MSQDSGNPKPLFSLVPENNDIDGDEEEEEQNTEPLTPVPKASATIIEGEEEEDEHYEEEPTTHTLPVLHSNPKLEDKTSVIKKTSFQKKLLSSNDILKKDLIKQHSYLYGRIKEELHKTSMVLDASIKTVHDAWDNYSAANTKIDLLNQKLSDLKNPILKA